MRRGSLPGRSRCFLGHLAIAILLTFFSPASSAAVGGGAESAAVRYTVSLAGPAAHRVRVIIELPSGAAERDLQLPVWNALYQVRDFSQYVNWVKARNITGQELAVRMVDKSRWRISGAGSGAQVEYEIIADLPGPYGMQLNQQHAFFNLAEILMYPTEARSSPLQLRFAEVPVGWRIATALLAPKPGVFSAENYDRLVDSPVEIGTFQESDFDEGGGHYRIVVDADPADYDLPKIVSTVRRIVAAETAWMNDRPFDDYLFVFHFPRVAGGGGMEHSYSTAIEVNARVLAENALALPEVTAHEFFHLWNVKRIRPQSLEPLDYTKENYTRALWFSEGVTNTVQDYMLLRAGWLDEAQYLDRLAGHIAELERRPAHFTQSAEESSLDAWLEKYPQYRLPQRSVSYYNKGELLGVVLDLTIRDTSHGKASLRDLLQWMNYNYAQQGRYFPDSEGVRQAAEAVSHGDLGAFFTTYVAGTAAVSWDDSLRSVGLHLVRHTQTVADTGFWATRVFDAPPAVVSVATGSEAERAGLEAGDSIFEINGVTASSDFQLKLAQLVAGDTLRLQVRGLKGLRELHWKLGNREEVEFELKDVENISLQQKARRSAWLKGEDQGETRP